MLPQAEGADIAGDRVSPVTFFWYACPATPGTHTKKKFGGGFATPEPPLYRK